MHSRTDTLIPYHCSQILFNSVPHSKKVLYTIEGDHSSPRIDEEILKQMFAFVGIQAECLDHHIGYVQKTLQKITSDNPGIIPNGGLFGVNI